MPYSPVIAILPSVTAILASNLANFPIPLHPWILGASSGDPGEVSMCSMFCDSDSMFQRGGEPRPRIQNSAVSMIDSSVRSSGASFEVYRLRVAHNCALFLC